ncbi:MAG: sugar ABC transporter permease [Clostridiales bacterium]|nr:sugar ABC transporter permease [Clostridiales bacterium]
MRSWSKGDIFTKLSLVIFGLGSVVRGQIIKGLAFFAVEALFFYYMLVSGAGYISKLGTLGTKQQGWVFDEAIGINVLQQGENSMLILLFGVLAIFMVVFFIFFAVKSVQASYKAEQLRKEGKKPPSVIDEIKALFDSNLHKSLLILPGLGVFAFTILPLMFMILMAFTNFDQNHQPPGNLFTWVGFENFKNIFWANPVWARTFVNIFIWTIIWAVFATFTNYFLGMLLALYINGKKIRLKKLWRTIFVMTIAVPQFVSLRLMGILLNDEGAVNVLLRTLGIIANNDSVQFLSSGTLARITVILVNVWVGIPYTMLITSGILMNIPADLYESAYIDGANRFQTFRKITLPYMLFVTTPYLITQFIANINNFNVIFLLNQGGPRSLNYYQGGETDLLVTWLYRLTVDFQDYNLASTIGIIIFIICGGLSLIFYNRSKSVREEEVFS